MNKNLSKNRQQIRQSPNSLKTLCQQLKPHLITLALLLLLPYTSNATPLNAAFSEIPEDLNFLQGTSPVELFVKNAISTSLFGTAQSSEQDDLDPSSCFESFTSDSSGQIWNFTIKPELLFSNGQKISNEDFINSFNNCQALKTAGFQSANFTAFNNLELTFNSTDSTRTAKLQALELCPIYSKQAATLFNKQHALNTNLVTRGYYKFHSIKQGKKIILVRATQFDPEKVLPEAITLTAYESPDKGLSRLRAGRVDLVFTVDVATLEKASNDVTLALSDCYSYSVIMRQSLKFVCRDAAGLVITSVTYDQNL